MNRRKEKDFTAQQVALAEFARTLSHPARIAIITFLQQQGEAPCSAIVENIPLAQSTVSEHIRTLFDAGLLNVRNCGTSSCYSLNYDNIRQFCHSFQCTLETMSSQ